MHAVVPNCTADEECFECSSEPTTPEVILCTIFLVFVTASNLLGNSIICWAVCRDDRLRGETRNTFVGSLALSDLAISPVIVYRIVTLYKSKDEAILKSCSYLAGFGVVLVYVSVLQLFLLCLDRYIAIIHPLRHRNLISEVFAQISLLAAWITPTVSVMLVPMLLRTTKHCAAFQGAFIGCFYELRESVPEHQAHVFINIASFILGPYLFMLFAYGRIIKISWYQSTRVQPGPNNQQAPIPAETALEVRAKEHSSNLAKVSKLCEQAKKKKEMKWVKTIGIIVGAFTISYIPIYVASLVRVRLGLFSVPCWLLKALALCSFANSALNPLIYSLRSREYKRVLLKVLRKRPSQVVGTEMTQRYTANRLNTTVAGPGQVWTN